MEKAIKALMSNNLPPRFKFKDTYDSIEVPSGYTLPSQQDIEDKFDELLAEEESMPTIDAAIEDIQVISSNLYVNTNTGRVGIGTTSPNYALDVNGTANVGALTATTISGPLTGNATTATTLQTARTIGGVSFDGSGNIDLPGVNTAGNQNTSGNAATATKLATARTIGGVSFDGSGNISLPGVNTTGNQNTSGNAATATTLQTARTIGGVSFDGSGNINLPGVNTAGNQNTSGNAATATTATNQSGGTVNATLVTTTTNGGAVRLVGTDHGYIEYYPAGLSSRKAWLGFGTPNGIDFSIQNDYDGNVLIPNGNVGIGTASPSTKLHVQGTSSSSVNWIAAFVNPYNSATTGQGSGIKLQLDGANAWYGDDKWSGITSIAEANWGDKVGMAFYTQGNLGSDPGNTPTEKMRISGSGNVGIGTTSPVGVNGGQRLEGSSSTGFEYIATRDDTSTQVGDFIGAYLFKNGDFNADEPHYAGIAAKEPETFGNMDLHFYTGRDNYENDTPQMTIDYDGNVGIGVTSPSHGRMQILCSSQSPGGGLTIRGGDFAAGLGAMWVEGSGSGQRFNIQAYKNENLADPAGVNPSIADVDAYQLCLNPKGGNVGIGNTNPAFPLTIGSSDGNKIQFNESSTPGHNITTSSGWQFNFNAGRASQDDDAKIAFNISGSSGYDEMMRVTHTGVGIGTTSPGYKLDVDGEVRTGNVLYIGKNTSDETAKTIYFGGTYGDNSYHHCVIEKRVWQASTEKQELLLFSGNDGEAGSGPDRIRLKGGQILFDTLNNSTDRTTENTKMIIRANGDVGIGTTSPSAKLHINTGATENAVFTKYETTGNGYGGIQFRGTRGSGTNGSTIGQISSYWQNNVRGHIIFNDGGDINILPTRNVGIGTATPDYPLTINTGDVKTIDGSTYTPFIRMTRNANHNWTMASNNTDTWNGNLYWFANINDSGAGYPLKMVIMFENDQSKGTKVNGNTFTGQHRNMIKGIPHTQIINFIGLIVSANSNKYLKLNGEVVNNSDAITINEAVPIVELSTVQYDKKCFGVISGSEDPESRTDTYGRVTSIFTREQGDVRTFVNSLGEGAIWVTNINGPLESGDYITTSNVPGYGMKQDPEFLANYTVAKITMDCDFNPPTQYIQQIVKETSNVNYYRNTSDIILNEKEYSNLTEEQKEEYTLEVREELTNVLDEYGQLQWEDTEETEKAYKIRYLTADGQITDEANAVHIAAFVGCTYHCG